MVRFYYLLCPRAAELNCFPLISNSSLFLVAYSNLNSPESRVVLFFIISSSLLLAEFSFGIVQFLKKPMVVLRSRMFACMAMILLVHVSLTYAEFYHLQTLKQPPNFATATTMSMNHHSFNSIFPFALIWESIYFFSMVLTFA